METTKWKEDLDTVKSEAIRFCPNCSRQAYRIKLNRAGTPVSAECILCGYKTNKGKII